MTPEVITISVFLGVVSGLFCYDLIMFALNRFCSYLLERKQNI